VVCRASHDFLDGVHTLVGIWQDIDFLRPAIPAFITFIRDVLRLGKRDPEARRDCVRLAKAVMSDAPGKSEQWGTMMLQAAYMYKYVQEPAIARVRASSSNSRAPQALRQPRAPKVPGPPTPRQPKAPRTPGPSRGKASFAHYPSLNGLTPTTLYRNVCLSRQTQRVSKCAIGALCKFTHLCVSCQGDHPAAQCPTWLAAKDAFP
jgi:hypothetical protein